MKFLRRFIWGVSGFGLVLTNGLMNGNAAETNELPHFQEVLRIIRANVSGLSETDLNRAAVQGLVRELHPKVLLVTNQPMAGGASEASALSKTMVYEGAYGYVRVARVGEGLADQAMSAYEQLKSTNKLKGLILDLRLAAGADYGAAAKTADLFLSIDKPLLDWGEGPARSTAKTNALSLPLAVLINPQTSGAAEALAAVLRQTDAGLLIGSTTAGQANIYKEFPLSSGARLRIAAAGVQLGDGKELSTKGVIPDIAVIVSPAEEKYYFDDPYRLPPKAVTAARSSTNILSAATTNAAPRRRLNEAELVRLQREGLNPDDDTPGFTEPEPSIGKPVIRDPVLARAVDLLKGLAVVQRPRPL